jgi:predicted nuclease of predicted toxin-antitoxin system
LQRAHREERVLITLDKDFGELAVVRGIEHCGILRLVNFPSRKQAEVSQRILVLYAEELQAGALITAEPGRVRIRPG